MSEPARAIRRALISVSDKTGIVDFARALNERGVEILSTGGTLNALRDGGIRAVAVEDFTGSPEVMGGRVKTLHPRVHGGILARPGTDDADLARIGGKPIDLVVVNLYPFEATAARGAPPDEVIENIDIGGPSLLRSAAKNHERVIVVCDPADYRAVLDSNQWPLESRRALAKKAFAHTAAYDGAIAAWLSGAATGAGLPEHQAPALERVALLRYGENPHQQAAWYRERGAPAGSLALGESLGAGEKELSFNNLIDLDAAIELVREFDAAAAAVIKHTNPCGLAVHESLAEAYRLAREGDPLSAFGGVVALNRACDGKTAAVIAETFIECVAAPRFDAEAVAILSQKKKLRIVALGEPIPPRGLDHKRIGGGFVVQEADATGRGEVLAGHAVSKRAPTPAELETMQFAWQACKHVKSNAIVLAQPKEGGQQIVGVGAGQMSRVQSVMIACEKAGPRSKASALASDAFFPFADNIEVAAAAGVRAIAQPGGSVKDAEVIAAADAAGLAMVLTGVRHFRH